MPTLADLFRACYLDDQGGVHQGRVDFSSVRLHYAGAGQACRAVRARAFTVGRDIYFADGAFNPGTRAGLWLLAHEVAHVVQQSAPSTTAAEPLSQRPVMVAPAAHRSERAADAAAHAFLAGRPLASRLINTAAPVPVAQRYMAWEHALLGDLDPATIRSMTGHGANWWPGQETGPGRSYCDLLAELGQDPGQVDEDELRARYPGLETVRLPGASLVVTLGELNVLADYLGHPDAVETAPAAFLQPLVQSYRSWNLAKLRGPVQDRSARRLLPGSLRYPLLGGLSEAAEVAAVDSLGKRSGLAPAERYSAVLARNADHFAPFSWHRWRFFHRAARALIERSAQAEGEERAELRTRAQIHAGYADHFLQDSFAAGHLINKTLVMQWYIEWLAESGVSYPHAKVLAAMTEARQPLLHGPAYYDHETDRGPDPGDEQRAYLTMLNSATVQLAAKVAHDHFNRQSLVVAASPDGPPFQLYGDRTLLVDAAGTGRAADAAALSRRAIAELLDHGETGVGSDEIFRLFPDHVEQDGRLISLPEWHRGGLRELCFNDLFRRWPTRALRLLASSTLDRLGRDGDETARG